MEYSVIVERFSEGDSKLHSMDPRFKIPITVCYIFVIALTDRLVISMGALFLAIVLLGVARLHIIQVLKSLTMLFIFIALLWVTLPLSVPGRALVHIGPLPVSEEGVLEALSISLKSLSIVLLIIALLGTTPVFTLVHAASHFKFPKKLLYLTFLSYRYIHVVQTEYGRLRDAMRVRGFRPRTNLHTYRTLGYLIGMLLIRSYERSERIYQAMLCRGFHGNFYLLDHFHLHRRDIIFTVCMTLILIFMGCVAWTGLLG
jgi:cobalt/nickel transport system permease protein